MSRSKSKRVVIVGSGLFGSIAARLCMDAGFHVTVIDAKWREAGSGPAACLMAPSWMSGLGDKATSGMEVLDRLYKVRPITFRMNSIKDVRVNWVSPRSILGVKPHVVVKGAVLEVGDGWVRTIKETFKGHVLIAAGVWCNMLIDMPDIQPLVGGALYYTKVVEPEIHVWAPYKQAVMFNIAPSTTWFGDGTSIIAKNWRTHRIDDSIKRAKKYGIAQAPRKIVVGRRPYVKGHKGYFEQIHQNTWVSTGGAKNGTVLAAHQAKLFLEAIS